MQSTLHGTAVTLRPPTEADVPRLADIRRTPQVYERWGGDIVDMTTSVSDDLADQDVTTFVIEYNGRAVGATCAHATQRARPTAIQHVGGPQTVQHPERGGRRIGVTSARRHPS